MKNNDEIGGRVSKVAVINNLVATAVDTELMGN